MKISKSSQSSVSKTTTSLEPPKATSKFDLTSSAGVVAAATLLLGGTASAAVLAPIAVVVGPLAVLAMHLSRRKPSVDASVSEPITAMTAPTTDKTKSQDHALVVAAILKAGKKQGLSEVEIVLESEAALNVGVNLPKALNVDLRFKAGKGNKTTVRARYKDA